MEEQALNIIKGAILFEIRGKTFYENVANQTKSKSVHEIFKTLAEEEDKHIAILSKHYTNLVRNGEMAEIEYDAKPVDISTAVLTEKIQQDITAAGYEAAAISAAMAMEERAIQYYSERANSTDNSLEKDLYQWLANWEKTHLQFLSDLDKELLDPPITG